MLHDISLPAEPLNWRDIARDVFGHSLRYHEPSYANYLKEWSDVPQLEQGLIMAALAKHAANLAAQHRLDPSLAIRLAVTDADREAVRAALAEYEELQLVLRDLWVPHLVAAALDKLAAAGLPVPSLDEARPMLLERKHSTADMENYLGNFHHPIHARLEAKVAPIVKRAKEAAIAQLNQARAAIKPQGEAVAKAFGLPAVVTMPQIVGLIQHAAFAISTDLEKPLPLANVGSKRDALFHFL